MPASFKIALIVIGCAIVVFDIFLTFALCKAASMNSKVEQRIHGEDLEAIDIQRTMAEYNAKKAAKAARKAKRQGTSDSL